MMIFQFVVLLSLQTLAYSAFSDMTPGRGVCDVSKGDLMICTYRTPGVYMVRTPNSITDQIVRLSFNRLYHSTLILDDLPLLEQLTIQDTDLQCEQIAGSFKIILNNKPCLHHTASGSHSTMSTDSIVQTTDASKTFGASIETTDSNDQSRFPTTTDDITPATSPSPTLTSEPASPPSVSYHTLYLSIEKVLEYIVSVLLVIILYLYSIGNIQNQAPLINQPVHQPQRRPNPLPPQIIDQPHRMRLRNRDQLRPPNRFTI